MYVKNTFRLSAFFSALLSVSLLIFAFQNCSSGGANAEDDDVNSSEVNSAPFAYDTTVDTLSYMSCSHMRNQDKSAYYTFKAAALGSDSGIKISSRLREYVGDRFPDHYQAVIRNSNSQSATLHFSVRGGSAGRALQTVTGDASGNIRLGETVGQMLGVLDSDEIIEELFKGEADQRVNFINNVAGLGEDRRLQGQIYFLRDNLTSGLRGDLSGSSSQMLALTYSSEVVMKNEYLALTDFADKARQAYGRGYFVDFGTFGLGADNRSDRVMVNVDEESLEQENGDSLKWSCPSLLRFKIVRKNDAVHGRAGFDGALAEGKTYCRKIMDPYKPGQNAAFDAIRGILDPDKDDWYIDLHNRCVINKKDDGSCYGSLQDNNNFIVKYDSTSCYKGDQNLSDCPHYISICVRKQIPLSTFKRWQSDGIVGYQIN